METLFPSPLPPRFPISVGYVISDRWASSFGTSPKPTLGGISDSRLYAIVVRRTMRYQRSVTFQLTYVDCVRSRPGMDQILNDCGRHVILSENSMLGVTSSLGPEKQSPGDDIASRRQLYCFFLTCASASRSPSNDNGKPRASIGS
jgi:hypothetical protein